MRVLHVIPGIAPRYGGPSTVIGPLCAALNQFPGMFVEILTTNADGARGCLVASDTPPGITTHMFPVTCSERWKFSAGLWHWIRKHAHEYDLIHIHAVWSFTTAAVASAARRAKVPYILRPAGMLSAYTWSRVPLRKQAYWLAVERRSVFGAAGFHATSAGESREIEAVRPGANIAIIPNGVDAAAWQMPRDSQVLRRLCGVKAGDRPIILFLSRLHPKKGIADFLLPAMARVKTDPFLAIAGGADEHAPEYADEIQRTIQEMTLTNRVAVLGPIAPADRWSLYDGAALFVLPSHSENFGIVVAEAMARGCPLVVSENTNSCEHVIAAEAGKVVRLEVESIARAIDDVLADSGRRDLLGRNGAQFARGNLSWDQIAPQVVEMYTRCLGQRGDNQLRRVPLDPSVASVPLEPTITPSVAAVK